MGDLLSLPTILAEDSRHTWSLFSVNVSVSKIALWFGEEFFHRHYKKGVNQLLGELDYYSILQES